MDAAEAILKATGQPLHYQEITQKAIDQELIQTQGKTPAATVNAVISVDIKKKGEASRFVRVKPGVFGLREFIPETTATDLTLLCPKKPSTPIVDISNQKLDSIAEVNQIDEDLQQIIESVELHQKNIRLRLKEILEKLDPIAFEHLIGRLLTAMNYQNVEVTSASNDKGVDVVADIEVGITPVREVVQAKRQKNNVRRPILDALRGSLHRFDATRGTVITTADFTRDAKKAAFERGAAPITLINGEKLIDLLIKYQIGVGIKTIEVIDLDLNWFSQLDSKV